MMVAPAGTPPAGMVMLAVLLVPGIVAVPMLVRIGVAMAGTPVEPVADAPLIDPPTFGPARLPALPHQKQPL
jgi:hypothetical protein